MDRRIFGAAALAVSAAGCLGSSYSQTLNVDFSPMYSGFDGVHTYQVPATSRTRRSPESPTCAGACPIRRSSISRRPATASVS